MGFYLELGRPREGAAMTRETWKEELVASGLFQGVDFDPAEDDFFVHRYGRADIIDTDSDAYPFQAPWVSLRFSWASGEELASFLEALIAWAHTHDLHLYHDHTALTPDNLPKLLATFQQHAADVRRLLGVIPT